MYQFIGRRCLWAVGLSAGFAVASAAADTIPLGGGWQASINNASNVGIVVDAVGADFVLIQISKDFTDPPGVGGVFPPVLIDFQQVDTDANTKPNIIINDETVTNLTGVSWSDFHWAVFDSGQAWFDVPASAGFDTSPFGNQVFDDPGGVFGDANKATDLWVDGGVLPNNASFFPGAASGQLAMGIDLSSNNPVSFTLKEFPTPEPTTALLLGLLGAFGLRRRK